MKQDELLRHVADLSSPSAQVDLAERSLVDKDLSRLRSHQATHDIEKGRLTCSGRSVQNDEVTDRNSQGYIVENDAVVISEGNTIKTKLALERRLGVTSSLLSGCFGLADQFLYVLERRLAVDQGAVLPLHLAEIL